MSLGDISDERFAEMHGPSTHPAGCTYGGFSCGYWLIADGCDLEHWERHITLENERCACGNHFPGAGRDVVFMDATD